MNANIYNPFPQLHKCAAISEGGEKKKERRMGERVRCDWMFLVCYYSSIFSPSFAMMISSMLYPLIFKHQFIFNNILQNARILPKLLVHGNTPTLDTHMHMQTIKTE
jgi:hypothetical protein